MPSKRDSLYLLLAAAVAPALFLSLAFATSAKLRRRLRRLVQDRRRPAAIASR